MSLLYRLSDVVVNRQCVGGICHDAPMHFGKQVKARRLELGLSQKALAMRARLSQTTIADIERGRNVGSRHLLALAEALELPPHALTDKAMRAQQPTPVYDLDLRYDRVAWRALPTETRTGIEFVVSAMISGLLAPGFMAEPPLRRRDRGTWYDEADQQQPPIEQRRRKMQ